MDVQDQGTEDPVAVAWREPGISGQRQEEFRPPQAAVAVVVGDAHEAVPFKVPLGVPDGDDVVAALAGERRLEGRAVAAPLPGVEQQAPGHVELGGREVDELAEVLGEQAAAALGESEGVGRKAGLGRGILRVATTTLHGLGPPLVGWGLVLSLVIAAPPATGRPLPSEVRAVRLFRVPRQLVWPFG
ncbi:MAG: hypothetical protein QME77_12070 [bacterium]|nr:hypothetical protein [bacterium]